MSRGMKPWRSPWPCTERGSMTRQERTPRSAAARAACMLVMRAAMGPAAMSSSRSVAGRPGVTSVAPEITRGWPEPASPVTNVSMALASVRVAASLTLGTTKARWMTPSLARVPARSTSVSFRSPRSTSAPRPATALAEASERASPRTWWPALTSSGTTAEPIQPEAPVTKMRMDILLGRASVIRMRGADAAAGTAMRFSRIEANTIMRLRRINYAVVVSRWAPDARERLESAALDLFTENGYDETTVAQIADRAGLNRATFFRHFADKREVLFGGEDVLAGLFADGIRAASPDAAITECLQAAFAAAGVAMTPQQRAKAAQRVLVVAANSELQERGLLKHARIAKSISAALRERGADELTARLGAEVGMLAFSIAVERWMKAGNDEPFPLHAAAALTDLQGRVAQLDSRSRLSPLTWGNRKN